MCNGGVVAFEAACTGARNLLSSTVRCSCRMWLSWQSLSSTPTMSSCVCSWLQVQTLHPVHGTTLGMAALRAALAQAQCRLHLQGACERAAALAAEVTPLAHDDAAGASASGSGPAALAPWAAQLSGQWDSKGRAGGASDIGAYANVQLLGRLAGWWGKQLDLRRGRPPASMAATMGQPAAQAQSLAAAVAT